MAAQTTVLLAYLIQDVPSIQKQSQFHRDSNLTLNFLATYFEVIGNFEIPLSLVALKVFARLHNNQELFEFFLNKFHSEDRKIAIFTSQVFKDFSLAYSEFVD